MNELEKKAKAALEARGWAVYRSGWPDFLCVKDNKVMAAEVKSDKDRVRDNQRIIHQILVGAGIPVKIVREHDTGEVSVRTSKKKKLVMVKCQHCGRRFWHPYKIKYCGMMCGRIEHFKNKPKTTEERRIRYPKTAPAKLREHYQKLHEAQVNS